MEKEEIKQHISSILDIGGKITFNYKGGIGEWYSVAEIYRIYESYGDNDGFKYILHGVPSYQEFKNKNEAIDNLVNYVFNENNLDIILERLKKKLNIDNFDEYDFQHPSDEFMKMINDEQQLYKKENDDNYF